MHYSYTLLGHLGLLSVALAAPGFPGFPPHSPPPPPPPFIPLPVSPPNPKSTLPARYPPLPGPAHSHLDDSVEAALAALGRSKESYRGPGSVPFPHLKEGTDTMPGIKHFVFLMMENHRHVLKCR